MDSINFYSTHLKKHIEESILLLPIITFICQLLPIDFDKIMPRNPKAPPYKSTFGISRSKETQKHMTTIPKPVIMSRWKSWNIKKAQDNTLIWFPSEYEPILNHLIEQWKLVYSEEIKRLKPEQRTNLFIKFDLQGEIKDPSAWQVIGKEPDIEPAKKWKWEYKTEKPEYLIHVLNYDIKTDLMIAQFGTNYEKIEEEELDVLYATVSLDLAKVNPTYWASLLKIKEIIKTALTIIISNV